MCDVVMSATGGRTSEHRGWLPTASGTASGHDGATALSGQRSAARPRQLVAEQP